MFGSLGCERKSIIVNRKLAFVKFETSAVLPRLRITHTHTHKQTNRLSYASLALRSGIHNYLPSALARGNCDGVHWNGVSFVPWEMLLCMYKCMSHLGMLIRVTARAYCTGKSLVDPAHGALRCC